MSENLNEVFVADLVDENGEKVELQSGCCQSQAQQRSCCKSNKEESSCCKSSKQEQHSCGCGHSH